MPTLPAIKNVNTAKEKATGLKLAGPSSLRMPRDMLHLLPRRSQENPLLGSIKKKRGSSYEASGSEAESPHRNRRRHRSNRVKVVQEDQRNTPMEGAESSNQSGFLWKPVSYRGVFMQTCLPNLHSILT